MYKECFKLMDINKDGNLDKSDLRAAFDNVGKLMDESELDSMLGEVGGPCSFDNMVKMFQEKMAGGKLLNLGLIICSRVRIRSSSMQQRLHTMARQEILGKVPKPI